MRLMLLALIITFPTAHAVAAQEKIPFCPTIEVVGPAGITLAGDDMEFVAKVNGTLSNFRYEWSVEGGKIVEGQGTSKIRVSGGKPNSVVQANVSLAGLNGLCKNTASEKAGVAPLPGCGMSFDEWGNLKPDDIRGRLDMLFADLVNNPDNTGLFTLYTVESERRNAENPRILLVVKHAKFRKIDLTRLVFVFEHETSEEIRTVVHRIPAGAEFPCPDCVRLNGSDLN